MCLLCAFDGVNIIAWLNDRIQPAFSINRVFAERESQVGVQEYGGDEQGNKSDATKEVDDEEPRQAPHLDISKYVQEELLNGSPQSSRSGLEYITFE